MSPSALCSISYFFLSFCVFCSVGHSASLQWVRLTNDNFTSDIRTHPFILCIATVPWCGESRSIMRALPKSIEVDEKVFSVVQFRVVYVNFDKILDLGRTKYPTLIFYRHSIPFQYKGKLKVQNILAAIHNAFTFNSWDIPFKRLETTSELNTFMESTDRAVVLFDFCNYSEKLRSSKQYQVLDKLGDTLPASRVDINMEEIVNESSRAKRQEYVEQYSKDTDLHRSEDVHLGALNVDNAKYQTSSGEAVLQEDAEFNLRPINRRDSELHSDSSNLDGSSSAKNHMGNVKDVKHQFVSCQPETEFLFANSQRSFPWMQSINSDKQKKSLSANSINSGTFSQDVTCVKTEYKRFAKVYRNLTNVVRNYALTPERANFAIIKDKSLLSDLGIDKMYNYTWFLMQWMADQPHLPRLYFENEKLDSFLSSSEQLVLELNRGVVNQYSTFSNKTASVILFIDRAASVLAVRRKSWEALRALRAFARDYVGRENNDVPVGTSMDYQMESEPENNEKSNLIRSIIKSESHTESHPGLKDILGHGALQFLEDQPIRVLNELSSKDHSVHSEATKQGSNVVLKILVEGENKLQLQGSLLDIISQKQEGLDLSKVLLSEDNAVFEVQGGKIVGKVDADHILSSLGGLESLLSTTAGSLVGQDSPRSVEKNMEMYPLDVCDKRMIEREDISMNDDNALSFYFTDGDDQWKDLILPGLPYPSLVILDSSKGGQFMFPATDQSINYLSLKAFVNQFAKDELQKTYLSEFAPPKPRKHVRPPFVNRDFHEADGVPRVTTENLIQGLLGSRMLEDPPKLSFECTEKMDLCWKKGTLVLFTTPSCGFCKRMELVFREVHQLATLNMGGYGGGRFLEQMAKHPYSIIDMWEGQEGYLIEGASTSIREFKEKLPRLLQIDCTANDCSIFFNSINQKEVYPSIILYLGGNKESPVIFEGGPMVQEILNFIAIETKLDSKILHILQGGTRNKTLNSTLKRKMGCHLPPVSPKSIHIDSNTGANRHAYHFTADVGKTPSSLSDVGDGMDQDTVKPIVYPTIGSVLVATDRLSKASKSFESASILIVKADGQEGFQGLIFNKPLAWNQLPGLSSEMEALVNGTVLCYGGPVIIQGQLFSSLSRLKGLEGFSEVVLGVYYGGPAATMQVLQSIKEAKLEAADFWFFLGQAVWGWQQLLNEIAEQSWNLTSYEEGAKYLPVNDWLGGSTISVLDLLKARENAHH